MPPKIKPEDDTTRAGRRAAAASTRARILVAARNLFIVRGYLGTKMDDVAADAEVALDTVYASVGTKTELFRLLVETAISGTDRPVVAEERPYVQAMEGRARSRPEARDLRRRHGGDPGAPRPLLAVPCFRRRGPRRPGRAVAADLEPARRQHAKAGGGRRRGGGTAPRPLPRGRLRTSSGRWPPPTSICSSWASAPGRLKNTPAG